MVIENQSSNNAAKTAAKAVTGFFLVKRLMAILFIALIFVVLLFFTGIPWYIITPAVIIIILFLIWEIIRYKKMLRGEVKIPETTLATYKGWKLKARV